MVKLLLSDVDGTLLTPEHEVTPRLKAAVFALKAKGIAMTVASSRPPLGMDPIISALELSLPAAAFNGGMIFKGVGEGRETIEKHCLAEDVTREAIEEFRALGLDAWLYTSREWWVPTADGPRVEREVAAVGYPPQIKQDLLNLPRETLRDALKLVGVSLDVEKIERAEAAFLEKWSKRAQVSRSNAAYVDITNLRANKGDALKTLAGLTGISPSEAATAGDMQNDVAMFKVSGLSIAMGNAKDDVKKFADHVTTTNSDDGLARAIETYLLGGEKK